VYQDTILEKQQPHVSETKPCYYVAFSTVYVPGVHLRKSYVGDVGEALLALVLGVVSIIVT
jgi:hypothetical protein